VYRLLPPGTVLTAAPSVSSWGKYRLDLFVQGRDGALWHRWFDNGWHDWEWLEKILLWRPVAVSWKPPGSFEDTDFPRIDVFGRARDSTLYYKWFRGGRWRQSESIRGELTSSPAVASWAYGRLDVFYRGSENALWHRSFRSYKWSGEESLGGICSWYGL
jgi:hypothetical protein